MNKPKIILGFGHVLFLYDIGDTGIPNLTFQIFLTIAIGLREGGASREIEI